MRELADLQLLTDLQMDMAEIYAIHDTGRHFAKLINLQRLNISFNFISIKDIAAINWKRLHSLRDLDVIVIKLTSCGILNLAWN